MVLGGSFFGDNLSFISDTTIAATRSLGVKMNDKFRTNLRIALPAALVALIIYTVQGLHMQAAVNISCGHPWTLIIPYLIVIATAAVGINVLLVLTLGIVSCIVLGLIYQSEGLLTMCSLMGDGIGGMSDLIIVTLLAAGLLAVIRHNGGIDLIIKGLTRHVRGSRGAQVCVSVLVGLVNLCTANNTIAIITVGDIARSIGTRFGIDPRKTASLLDTCSCIVQCIIPYGAQTLLAAGLAQIAPIAFLPHLYYAWALAAMVAISIVVKRRG